MRKSYSEMTLDEIIEIVHERGKTTHDLRKELAEAKNEIARLQDEVDRHQKFDYWAQRGKVAETALAAEKEKVANLEECLRDRHDDWSRIQDADRKIERLIETLWAVRNESAKAQKNGCNVTYKGICAIIDPVFQDHGIGIVKEEE